jgi:hypothetical protein
MKVVLIWNLIDGDEPLQAFLISNPSDDDLNLLNKANGKISSVDEYSEEVAKIWDYISKKDDCYLNNNDQNNGKWIGNKISIRNGRPILCESINRIYICGARF